MNFMPADHKPLHSAQPHKVPVKLIGESLTIALAKWSRPSRLDTAAA
jgi:hypothetical protein